MSDLGQILKTVGSSSILKIFLGPGQDKLQTNCS